MSGTNEIFKRILPQVWSNTKRSSPDSSGFLAAMQAMDFSFEIRKKPDLVLRLRPAKGLLMFFCGDDPWNKMGVGARLGGRRFSCYGGPFGSCCLLRNTFRWVRSVLTTWCRGCDNYHSHVRARFYFYRFRWRHAIVPHRFWN